MNTLYRLPFDGAQRITSPFGPRVLNGVAGYHNGLDIVSDGDKLVHPVIAGAVKSSTMIARSTGNITWQWGNYVKVLGDDGRFYFYCHLASRAVRVGDRVTTADVLGVMGNTGYSFGAHTHFEVRSAANKALNAAVVLGIDNKVQSLDWTQKNSGLVVAAANLNVRSAPGTGYGKVGLLSSGTTADITEKSDNWGYIAGKGWVCLDYTKTA